MTRERAGCCHWQLNVSVGRPEQKAGDGWAAAPIDPLGSRRFLTAFAVCACPLSGSCPSEIGPVSVATTRQHGKRRMSVLGITGNFSVALPMAGMSHALSFAACQILVRVGPQFAIHAPLSPQSPIWCYGFPDRRLAVVQAAGISLHDVRGRTSPLTSSMSLIDQCMLLTCMVWN